MGEPPNYTVLHFLWNIANYKEESYWNLQHCKLLQYLKIEEMGVVWFKRTQT